MLRKYQKYLFVLIVVHAVCAAAWAESTSPAYDPCVGVRFDSAPNASGIAKVKPVLPPLLPSLKVKPASGVMSRLEDFSQYSPTAWLSDCCLPAPTKGQFLIGPKVHFARIQGEARKGLDNTALNSTVVDFDDHLGLKKSGNVVWSVEASYQLRPRWGLRYSFTPYFADATGTPKSNFNFAGQTFTGGTQIFSKWEHLQHRAGLYFNVSRTQNTDARLFADWIHLEDKLSVGPLGGIGTTVTWDDTKNLAMVGFEIDRCLRNYHGNTLAFSGKGGIAFLNDTIGYEAEAALNYLIPIRTGRFGFVKGGYNYMALKKDKAAEMLNTTFNGAFLQLGFLF